MSVPHRAIRRRLSLLASSSLRACATAATLVLAPGIAHAACSDIGFGVFVDDPVLAEITLTDTTIGVFGYGAWAMGGAVNVEIECPVITDDGFGVIALSQGPIFVRTTEEADFLSNRAYGGLLMQGAGGITVQAAGDFGTSDTPLGPFAISAMGQGISSPISITADGDIYVGSPYGDAAGIRALSDALSGDVTIDFGLARPATLQSTSIGILASRQGGSGDVAVRIGDGVSIMAVEAVGAGNGGQGDALVQIGSGVTIEGVDSGVVAGTTDGNAQVSIGNDFTLVGRPGADSPQIGVAAYAQGLDAAAVEIGDGATINVGSAAGHDSFAVLARGFGYAAANITLGDGLSVASAGDYAVGVAARSDVGDVGVIIGSGSINVSEGAGGFWFPDLGVSAAVVGDSGGGDITLDVAADVSVANLNELSAGLYAKTVEDGGIDIASAGDIEAAPESLFSYGILAQSVDGDIEVTASGAIIAGAVGISAQAADEGSVSVTSNGSIQAATGIAASSGRGDVLVTTGAASLITQEGFGSGIAAQSGGSVSVVAAGDITAEGIAVWAQRVVFVSGPGGLGDPPPPVVPGDVEVIVNGDVNSTSFIGAIVAQNDADAGDVTARFGMGDGAALTAASTGLLVSNTSADNTGDVAVIIGAGGSIEATRGVSAFNAGSGDVTVTTAGDSSIVAATKPSSRRRTRATRRSRLGGPLRRPPTSPCAWTALARRP